MQALVIVEHTNRQFNLYLSEETGRYFASAVQDIVYGRGSIDLELVSDFMYWDHLYSYPFRLRVWIIQLTFVINMSDQVQLSLILQYVHWYHLMLVVTGKHLDLLAVIVNVYRYIWISEMNVVWNLLYSHLVLFIFIWVPVSTGVLEFILKVQLLDW